MPRVPVKVESATDPRIGNYQNLPGRKSNGQHFIAEGMWLLERLAQSRFEVHSILTTSNRIDKVAALADSHGIHEDVPIYVAPAADVDEIVGFQFHRGVMACGVRKPSPPMEDLVTIPDSLSSSDRRIVVVCPKIANDTNLGSIVRAATAFGASGLLLGAGSADPFSRRALRVAMGATLTLPVRISECLGDDLAWLQGSDFEIVGAVLNQVAVPAGEITTRLARQHVAIAVGPEDFGLSQPIMDSCDHLVTIPMYHNVDSLNVAMATGILLHELRRTQP